MKKFWKNESTLGKFIWAGMAIAFVLLFFGVIDSPDYGSGGRR